MSLNNVNFETSSNQNEHDDILNVPISLDKINKSLIKLITGKAAGKDGLLPDFFLKFA